MGAMGGPVKAPARVRGSGHAMRVGGLGTAGLTLNTDLRRGHRGLPGPRPMVAPSMPRDPAGGGA